MTAWRSFGNFGVSERSVGHGGSIYITPYGELCFCAACRLKRKTFGPTPDEAEAIALYEQHNPIVKGKLT